MDEIPDPNSIKESVPGRPVTAKPALDAYMPEVLKLVKNGPIQVSVFELSIAQAIVDNVKLGRAGSRAMKELLTSGDTPQMAKTRRRIGHPQFIGKPDQIQKIDQEQKQGTLPV